MIELHRQEKDSFADEIDQKLKSMVVAYRTVWYNKSSDTDLPDLPPTNPEVSTQSVYRKSGSGSAPAAGFPLPHIRDSGNLISGKQEIISWLDELDRELQQHRSVSGDGCYIDPETGKIC